MDAHDRNMTATVAGDARVMGANSRGAEFIPNSAKKLSPADSAKILGHAAGVPQPVHADVTGLG